MTSKAKILILGGTRDARDLARLLVREDRFEVITSLAGRTKTPDRIFGQVRTGGFGGSEGLAGFVLENSIRIVIDATHPFATQISANAAKTAQLTGVSFMVLERPPWQKKPGDIWHNCADLAQAAKALPGGAVAFLALGHQHLGGFSHRGDVRFIARMIDPPEFDIPLRDKIVVIGSPSTDVNKEASLFKLHGVSHLVCRNSGGALSYAKIAACRQLHLPVMMIARPHKELAPLENRFDNVKDLAAHIGKINGE